MLQQPPQSESVFEIRLNEEGIARLKQTLMLSKLLLAIGAVEILVFGADSTLRFLMIRKTIDSIGNITYAWMSLYGYPAYSLLYIIFFIAYLIYTLIYTRKANEAIAKHDSQLFNDSYRYLVTSFRVSLVIVILNLIIWLIFFVMEINYYKNIQS